MAGPYSFAHPAPYDTPPYAPTPSGRPSIMGTAIANATKPAGGGLGKTLGGIGSFIMEALTGVPSAAHRQQREDREFAQLERRGLLQQQLEQGKWQQQQDYERSHPKPQGPTNTQQTYEYLKQVRPDLADGYLTNFATAPPLVVPNGDGTRTVYPQGSIPRTASPAQPQILQQLPPGVKPYTPGGAPSTGARTFPVR